MPVHHRPDGPASAGGPDHLLKHPVFTRLLLPVAVLTFYFLVPVGSGEAPVGDAVGFLVGAACIGLIAWVVVQELRRAQRLQPVHLILVLEFALVVFALVYYTIAVRNPGEFNGLTTRLDALYFSMTTMSTVGYGDVNAAGQWSRGLVTIQLALNLVFVGGLIALIQEQVRERRRSARAVGGPDATYVAQDDGGDSGPSPS